jgi:Arc/MetJ family transcription regulator
MLIYIIAVAVIFFVIIGAILMAKGAAQLDKTVQMNKVNIENQGAQYNLALTGGYQIPINEDIDTQMKKARKLAAKKAAALPRGGNMGIGRLGEAKELKTAWMGVDQDPMTAVRIAAYHGWDGLQTGAVMSAPAAAAPAAPAQAPDGKIELVPGKDYPVIEITEDMAPADVRKARVANAKAKSAAMKAAKAAGAGAATVTAAQTPAAAAAPTAAVSIPEPVLIEITDDMAPDEVRKARIANAKAQSAYKKALKAAGAGTQAVSTASAPAPAASPTMPATAVAIPEPELIEITDDMAPDDIRKARIVNAKAQSAYKKALKAAGVAPVAVPAPEPAPAAEVVEPAAAPAANLPPAPDLIEITEEMAAEDMRAARIANAKAMSAYKKGLKAAGIDPKSVKV